MAGEAGRDGTAPPLKETRNACWSARDSYFACLDREHGCPTPADNAIGGEIEASKLQTSPCYQLREMMYHSCPPLWVWLRFALNAQGEHFELKRINERKRDLRIRALAGQRQGASGENKRTG